MSNDIPSAAPVLRFDTPPRVALVVSRFNEEVTGGLRAGAPEWLREHEISVRGADIMQAALDTGVPVAFGVLTTYTDEQAVVRSRTNEHNKGREAAAACVETISILQAIARPE